MRVTDQFLDKWEACKPARQWLAEKGTRDFDKLYKLAKKENHLNWVNWYVAHRLKKMDRVKYAIYAAELVLPIFEDAYPP